jgi:hypothetical protein
MLHANELLGKYDIPTDFDSQTKCIFEFDGKLWSSSHPDEKPLDQVPPIATTHHSANLPPEDLQSNGHQELVGCTASFDHPGCRGTPEALPKFSEESDPKHLSTPLAENLRSNGHQELVGSTASFDHQGCRGTPEALPKIFRRAKSNAIKHSDEREAHTPVASSVHSQVAHEVPNSGATISLDGPKVHTRVAAKVPSLGASISLDG